MRSHILRNDLLSLVDKCLNYPLTLVVAAAGSGKSTMLTHWHENNQKPLILRIDLLPHQNDAIALIKRILDGLRQHTTHWDAPFFSLFKPESTPQPAQLIAALMRAFEAIDYKLVIIIDDFHCLSCEISQSLFGEFFHTLPDHIHFVISTRMYPQFSLIRLRLEEKVLLIDSNDLKLQRKELNELNTCIGGLPLTEQQTSALIEQSEGWIVGVKLALLAHKRDGHDALDAFSGSQPELLNYFGFEVLKKLDNRLREFVLHSAIFEHFDTQMCEKILGFDNCSSLLECLVKKELFLLPHTEARNHFRYHSLLQDFLQDRLLIERGSKYIEDIHQRTARYLLDKEMFFEAIFHVKKAHNESYYYEVLDKACHHWLRDGEFESVLSTLSQCDESVFERRHPLTITLIYALMFSRRFNEAEYYLTILKNALSNAEIVEAYEPISADSLHALEQSLLLFQQDIYTVETTNFSIPKQEYADPDIQAFSLVAKSYTLLRQGRIELALRSAYHVKTVLAKTGHVFLLSYINLIIALCDRYMGRGIDAALYISDIFLSQKNKTKTPTWANLATGMMVIHYEQNKMEDARHLCEELLPLVDYSSATEVVANVYLGYSRLLYLSGESNKASRLLTQLERILLFGKYDRFHGQVVQESMRQALADRNHHAAENLMKQYDIDAYTNPDNWKSEKHYQERQERLALAAVYYFIAKGELDNAYDTLTQLCGVLEPLSIKSRTLVVKCNLIVVAFYKNNQAEACNQLKDTLDIYGISCFSRSVFDEAPGLSTVFCFAVTHDYISLPEAFTDLFSEFFTTKSVSNDSVINPEALLTEKELQIFDLLSDGLSNIEIGKQADIALSTTKWHLKNIYTKLGVTSRTAAMMLANHR